MRKVWIIGSVATVADRIVNLYKLTGGFGTLLWAPTDWGDEPERARHTMKLLLEEVLPRVTKTVGTLPMPE
jgi:alkanesulfonate monooxygenase SsuD/methylene tetrahydromethanopterin reductase-like flavin-dependent oxidoreductase (luciferase family)